MIHPDTELQFINEQIGYGVFATADIPLGTIVYVKDKLEIEISQEQYKKLDKLHAPIVDKYSYIDHNGAYIMSWDNARYVNHRCDCNTISTGYGFEIAIRDISRGEEITDDYGLFNLANEFEVHCNCPDCREVLRPTDIDEHHAVWDMKIRKALKRFKYVEQPLWGYMDEHNRKSVISYLSKQDAYRSVLALKWSEPRQAPNAGCIAIQATTA